jgi:hypothetical protein
MPGKTQVLVCKTMEEANSWMKNIGKMISNISATNPDYVGA